MKLTTWATLLQRRSCGALAWILLSLAPGVVLSLSIASIAAADPTSALGGALSIVRFDPNVGPSASESLSVTAPPVPPQYVTSPLTFNFTPVGNLLAMQSGTPAQQALASQVVNGFVAAGDRWRALFVDPITVNLEIDYGPLGNGVLGGASSDTTVSSYTSARAQLTLDAKSVDDATAVANLQVAPSMQFMTNNTSFNNAPNPSPRIRDSDTIGTAANNNNYLDISRANAKAIGISVPAGRDANITFTDFSDFGSPYPAPPNVGWDFDPSDGIASNRIDFVGVATHEIGHTMGFFSGVDSVDYFGSPNGPGRPLDLNPYAVYNTLDLYRFSANSLAQGSQPVGGLKDLADSQSGTGPFFSINGGATNLALFATGAFNGDGSQASHWKDGLGIGIMDPTFGFGELGVLTALDRRAMDVIGWDPQAVPEPGGLALLFMAALALLVSRPSSRIRLAA